MADEVVPQERNRENARITVALTGDVMLGRMMNEPLHKWGPAYPWGDTLPLLRGANLTIMNLECVVAADGRPWTRWPKVFHFRADPIALEALREAGTDCVSLANNHTLDYEYEGLLEMLDRLEGAAIAHAGAGRNLEEARRPALLEAGGLRLGVLALTDNEPNWAAAGDRPGTNYLRVSTEPEQIDRMQRWIAETRALGADLVLVSNHWGPNMRLRPSPEFQRFARAILDAGADLYLGHSAHLFQGIEGYQGKPIFYDAGDFVDDYAVDPDLRNDWSALVLCTLGPTGVEAIRLFPVLISDYQVNLARGSDFEAIGSHLQRLSAEFGTRLELRGRAMRVEGL
jgi:poly-gamma-glutamate capsule biosynthesis protein CapA/YwtB (metallophosphatase superfamily)